MRSESAESASSLAGLYLQTEEDDQHTDAIQNPRLSRKLIVELRHLAARNANLLLLGPKKKDGKGDNLKNEMFQRDLVQFSKQDRGCRDHLEGLTTMPQDALCPVTRAKGVVLRDMSAL